ncbi:hypothetical protein IWY39_000044 [Sphingobium sp. JAI105]|uniref:hypothetical protein n=1 Tax=Sphingobium sp. JAI105 TaxID=2787715 RepID=UPI0018CBCF12|nr:hypothetical protein [Sphingobium sp. JAI105]MBG6116240.1 hypothetical protein [Sphingobium sp. JAI105]
MTQPFDQFTRWLCPKCGLAGIDSWNKALFDGIDHGDAPLPDPWILGTQCDRCVWPCVVSYARFDVQPTAIFGPLSAGAGCFAYEDKAMAAILADRTAGEMLAPSDRRDFDWSRGCLAARGQLQ